jgi:hypothetical protein
MLYGTRFGNGLFPKQSFAKNPKSEKNKTHLLALEKLISVWYRPIILFPTVLQKKVFCLNFCTILSKVQADQGFLTFSIKS